MISSRSSQRLSKSCRDTEESRVGYKSITITEGCDSIYYG